MSVYRLEFELLDGRLRYRVCDGGSHTLPLDESLHLQMLNGAFTVDVSPRREARELDPEALDRACAFVSANSRSWERPVTPRIIEQAIEQYLITSHGA